MKHLFYILAGCLALTACSRAEREITVLQLNIWQEGTSVPNGYEALVEEIAAADADFVTLSEVRNYNDTRFCDRIIASLKAKGKTYYSFKSKDSGLLSKYPISDSVTIFPENNDHGSIYKLTAALPSGEKVCLYTAHLDYTNCAYYMVRGYCGSTWDTLPQGPETRLDTIMYDNIASQRDDAIRRFLDDAAREAVAGNLIFLGGDFNEPSHLDWTEATKDSADHHGLVVPWTVTTLLEQGGYADAYRTRYPNPVTHPGYTYPADCPAAEMRQLLWAPKADERERIDYIFYYPQKNLELKDISIYGPRGSVRRGVRTEEQTADPFIPPTTGNWPTDHKGLIATFRLK